MSLKFITTENNFKKGQITKFKNLMKDLKCSETDLINLAVEGLLDGQISYEVETKTTLTLNKKTPETESETDSEE